MRTFLAVLALASGGLAAGADPLALLEQHCVSCHNHDDRKGGVVLDRSPLVLDNPGDLLASISGPEPEMPKGRPPLSAEDRATLEAWVQAGAPIPADRILRDRHVPGRDWWSLRPLDTQEGPLADQGGSDAQWGRNKIDTFVLAKLREKGLPPSPEAAPDTLARRLHFDLTGLPPSPEEIAAFVAAYAREGERAYLALVDRLLASPAHGEHFARHWLDVARYGETHGYDKDQPRPNAWPYRDYVIRSFNEDKAWSDFVREQVAGDVLKADHPDGIVALGFLAAGPWDLIAHSEVGEGKVDGRIAKHMDRDDIVGAVFNAFMSTTVQCAQCHHHKFDPVSMEDYYRLHAVFAAVDRAERIYDIDPPLRAQRERLVAEIDRDIAAEKSLLKKRDELGGTELADLRARIRELNEAGADKIEKESSFGYHSRIAPNPSEEKWVQVSLPKAVSVAEIVLFPAHDDFGGIGAGFGFPLRYRVETAADADFRTHVRVVADRSGEDVANPGIEAVRIATTGLTTRHVRITATKLAPRRNDHIFALAELKILDEAGNNLAADAEVLALDSIEAAPRWSRKNLVDGKFPRAGDPAALRELTERRRREQDLLASLGTEAQRRERDEIATRLAARRKELGALPEGKRVYAAATHFAKFGQVVPTEGRPREIRLLHRGDIRQPGERMKPGAPVLWEGGGPEFALRDGADEGEARAALAAYLVSPENPLTWRSAANRVWLWHFGRGLVDSPNDFGRMGMLPTHPELLDFLAATLRDDPQQSLKSLHRLLVTSATWRQRSHEDAERAALDGENALYWRAHRRRLSAEELRDAVLAASGKLNRERGGPSFQDFVIEKPEHSPHYQYHLHDPDDPRSQRRSIYRMIARSQTQPFLTALDCADPSQMVAKRDETTTALQALALMNNPFVTTMAGHFAARVSGAPDPVAAAFAIATGRAPEREERQALTHYAATHGLPNTCRLLFNLSEFAYVD